jgi:lipoprotein-anchoring transpeptidase ErfK/SrfK
MRRLVVISNRKTKAIGAGAALVLTLTSIHMAATARTETVKRQLEQTALSIQQSAISQASATPIQPVVQLATNEGQAKQQLNDPAAADVALAVPARSRQIVISIADRKLAVMDNGRVLKIYPIAVGARGTPSPDGDFVVINHAKDPTYRHGDMEIAPGKDNPLGSRWMGLSLKGYGIHGTNVQSSVGKAASHGCFRMRKQDVEELYTLVEIGDLVTVRRERDVMIAQVFAPSNAPAAAPVIAAAKAPANSEVQVASATVTTVETAQQ